MEQLLIDVRYAARRLLREPGFALLAATILALGIGLTSAIYSLIDAMVLHPLPYQDPGRLVFLTEWSEQVPNMSFSVANFKDLRDQSTSFSSLAALRPADYTLTGDGPPEQLDGRQVTANFFATLGIRPLLGRSFSAQEDQPGGEHVCVLTEPFWARRFGRDPGVVGRSLILNGEGYTVVGIVPARFHGSWKRRDVFTPLLALEDQIGGAKRRGNHPGIYVIGRLKPGTSVAQARTEVKGIAERLARQYPDSSARQSMTLRTLAEAVAGDSRAPLLVLLGAVGLVLLIGCANVANLLLARGAARQRELAVRSAVGATRARVVRQLLTESALLGLVGGSVGILVAYLALRGFKALIPAGTAGLENAGLDLRVLGVALLLSLATGVLFGLVPALRVSGTDHDALKEGGRTLVGGHQRLRHALVVAEVSLSLVLLVGAGLLLRSFMRVLDADPGFDPKGVVTATVSLPRTDYADDEKVRLATEQVIERVRALPHVESVGSTLPLLGGWQTSFLVEGRPEPKAGERPSTDITRVSDGYFDAMGVRLLTGRVFDERDTAASTHVCIVDETFARTYWPDEDPTGKRIRFGHDKDNPWLEIVGVVRHVKNYGVDQESRVETYVPYRQSPIRGFTLVIRADGPIEPLVEGVRRSVLSVDPNLPVFEVQTLEEVLSDERSSRRIAALLTGAFAALALVLAAVGIYGVMSYSVAQRTGEIGVRLALGAERRDILRLVLGRGMALTGFGLGLGLVAALGLSRLVASLLFQVSPTDPPTYSVTPLVLTAAALVACYLPARRAMRVEPGSALRYE
jgi:putative ABC transport system permease protein